MLNVNEIKELVSAAEGQVMSLYLDVDTSKQENQGANPAWRTWLKNTLRELPESRDPMWKDMLARMERRFATYEAKNNRSLAVISGPNEEEHLYELPFPMENQIAFGKPLVLPLLWAIDEYEMYIVALVDKEEARLFTAYLGQVGFQDSVAVEEDETDRGDKPIRVAPQTGEYVTRGSARDEFEDRTAEHEARMHRNVVERIQKLMDKYNVRRIVLGGNEQSAHGVRNQMPEKMAQAVIALMPIPMRQSPPEIFEQILSVAQEYERQQEIELVNQVIDFAKAGGRGALGEKAVMEALDMQRVELLILPWPLDNSQMAMDLPFRVFASGGNIELVHGEAADRLNQEGGLAARLYYAI
jgi:hypothetical protein